MHTCTYARIPGIYWLLSDGCSVQFFVTGGIPLGVDRFRSAWFDCSALGGAARPCHRATRGLRFLLPGVYGSGFVFTDPTWLGGIGFPAVLERFIECIPCDCLACLAYAHCFEGTHCIPVDFPGSNLLRCRRSRREPWSLGHLDRPIFRFGFDEAFALPISDAMVVIRRI